MHHINPERIAALADEPATLVERSHLEACAECASELVVAQRLMHMAMTDTPAIERPITTWERLGPALRAEGLVHTPVEGTPVVSISSARAPRYRWAMQAAAGLFLAVSGAVVGRASAAMPGEEGAGTTTASTDTNFQSTADAMTVLQHASDQSQRALAYLAVNDSSVPKGGAEEIAIAQARLDVLNRSVAAAGAALVRAPQDPLMNNYYTQSVRARDLTLRQIGQAVPASFSRRTRF